MAEAFKGVRYWVTFNEPYVLLLGGYLEGAMPPGICNRELFVQAFKHLLQANG